MVILNRTKQFIYNSATTAFLQIITMIAGFIIIRVMLQYYGSEINGLVSSTTQLISYFYIVESGLSGAAVYALYKPIAENNYKVINGIISAAKNFYMKAGYIFVALILGFAFIYPAVVQIKTLNPFLVGLLILIIGVNGSLEFFTLAKYRAILTADQKTYIISIASIANIVVNTIIIIIFSSFLVNIVTLRFIALLSVFLRSLILMVYVKSKYQYIEYNVKLIVSALERRWDVMYLQVMGVVRSGVPIVILTFFLNDLKLVSVYTVFNMVVLGLSGILSIFISGLPASFGDVIARNQTYSLQRAYNEFEFSYYSIISAVYGITFVTIMPFIRIYTAGITDANYNLPIVGFLFVLNALMFNIHTPQAMLVESAGMYKETRLQTTTQGLLVIVCCSIFGFLYGITGIILGGIISNIYRNIALLFFTPKKITKTSVRTSFFRMLRVLISTAVICVPLWLINFSPSNYQNWVLFATSASGYSILIVLLNGYLFDKVAMSNSIQRMLSTMKSKKINDRFSA